MAPPIESMLVLVFPSASRFQTLIKSKVEYDTARFIYINIDITLSTQILY